jgi:hypothetical protein
MPRRQNRRGFFLRPPTRPASFRALPILAVIRHGLRRFDLHAHSGVPFGPLGKNTKHPRGRHSSGHLSPAQTSSGVGAAAHWFGRTFPGIGGVQQALAPGLQTSPLGHFAGQAIVPPHPLGTFPAHGNVPHASATVFGVHVDRVGQGCACGRHSPFSVAGLTQ